MFVELRYTKTIDKIWFFKVYDFFGAKFFTSHFLLYQIGFEVIEMSQWEMYRKSWKAVDDLFAQPRSITEPNGKSFKSKINKNGKNYILVQIL